MPYWAYRLEKVFAVGRHIFYRFPGSAGRASQLSARWSGNEHYPTFDPSRFAETDDMVTADGLTDVPLHLQRTTTERRADNDVGGRMDPTLGWKLAIPDPVSASRELESAFEQQGSELVVARGNNLP